MAIMHYAKLNVNSTIHEYEIKTDEIRRVMNNLYDVINDRVEFIHEYTYTVLEDGEPVEKTNSEIYCLSNIIKHEDEKKNEKYIVATLVRRFPLFIETFDEVERKSEKAIVEDNSVSIMFYFDLKSEIITFCNRRNFKHNMFVEFLSGVMNQFLPHVDFEIVLLNSPFDIMERIKTVKKVTKIKTMIVPENNINDEALKVIRDAVSKEMKEGNIGKRTTILETSSKSQLGLNRESTIFKEELKRSEALSVVGYSTMIVEGYNSDGTRFKFDSNEDSLYETVIENKENFVEFVNESKAGITKFLNKLKQMREEMKIRKKRENADEKE